MPALDPAIRRTRTAVLEAFRAREPGAVRELYRDFGGSVYAVAHRVLGRDDLAAEATRRTFARAWQAADRIDIERDPAEWLATLAKVSAVELSHERAVGHDDADFDTLDTVWRVRRAIDHLPPEQAVILRMQHVEGLGLSEISQRLEVPLAMVRSRSERAHQRLAALLGRLRVDVNN